MKTTKKLRNIGIFSKITLLTTVVIVTISTLSTIFVLQQFSGSMKEKDLLLIREASEKIYDFTKDSVTQLLDNGVDVCMVQVGNETNNGMAGETQIPNIAQLMKDRKSV